MGKTKADAIRSMTGFGNAECIMRQWHIAVDIRSVNGRFFDFSLRSPDELRPLETWLREQVSSSVQRGKVDMRISLRRQAGLDEALEINMEMFERLLKLVSQIESKAKASSLMGQSSPAPYTALDLLRFPGVTVESGVIDQELLQDCVKRLVPEAIASLEKARSDEGVRLADFLRERLARIREHCQQLHGLIPSWSAALESRLRERLSTLGFGDAPAATAQDSATHSTDLQQRLAQELGLHLIKSDVAEELSRLQAHSAAVEHIIAQGGPCGKRLDFMMQELQREANTLGSKSQIVDQSMAAVDLKVLIEQMREQVQNLE